MTINENAVCLACKTRLKEAWRMGFDRIQCHECGAINQFSMRAVEFNRPDEYVQIRNGVERLRGDIQYLLHNLGGDGYERAVQVAFLRDFEDRLKNLRLGDGSRNNLINLKERLEC